MLVNSLTKESQLAHGAFSSVEDSTINFKRRSRGGRTAPSFRCVVVLARR